MAKPQRPLADKFWERVTLGEKNTCWPFDNAKGGNYGYVWHDGGLIRAHRVSWILHHGPITHGLEVLHTCDNPACVNPDHLFIGTQAENVEDMIAKGRQAVGIKKSRPGEKNGRSKLTDKERQEMRDNRALGWLIQELSDAYGISCSAVVRSCKGIK